MSECPSACLAGWGVVLTMLVLGVALVVWLVVVALLLLLMLSPGLQQKLRQRYRSILHRRRPWRCCSCVLCGGGGIEPRSHRGSPFKGEPGNKTNNRNTNNTYWFLH